MFLPIINRSLCLDRLYFFFNADTSLNWITYQTTLFNWQRRINKDVSFDRNWSDYKNGFGNLNNNFWLGLDHVHDLCGSVSKVLLFIIFHTSYFSLLIDTLSFSLHFILHFNAISDAILYFTKDLIELYKKVKNIKVYFCTVLRSYIEKANNFFYCWSVMVELNINFCLELL